MRYEVQHYTLCDGWVNNWLIHDDARGMIPETFPTREQAQAALDEFLDEIREEIAIGQRAADNGFDPCEFRVSETGAYDR